MTFFTLLATVCLFAGISHAKEISIKDAKASSWKEWGSPASLIDGDTSTAWVGGRQGVGPGKMLTFTLSKPTTIGMIRIANGNQGKGKFDEFRSITRGILVLQDRGVHHFELKSERGEQDIVFPQVKTSSFVIIIEEVSGTPPNVRQGKDKVAVSEVRAYSESDGKVSTLPAREPIQAQAQTVPELTKEAAYFSATKPGRLYLKAMVPAPTNKTRGKGKIHKLASKDLITPVREYFARLTKMTNSYADVFANSIREREHTALVRFREKMLSDKRYYAFINAKPDSNNLSFDKPIIRGPAAMIRVHGIYRITHDDKAFETPVNALFSFIKEDGEWRINGVQKKR